MHIDTQLSVTVAALMSMCAELFSIIYTTGFFFIINLTKLQGFFLIHTLKVKSQFVLVYRDVLPAI